MSDRYFLDTNILIYSLGNIAEKKSIALDLVRENGVISTQIIAESANVMHRKLKYGYSEIRSITDMFLKRLELRIITHETIRSAFDIAERYGYSYYDSQVMASAIESGCSTLYSEDLQHNQIVENLTRITNPFKSY